MTKQNTDDAQPKSADARAIHGDLFGRLVNTRVAIPQNLINLGIVLWSTFHDLLYIGAYAGYQHITGKGAKRTLEERLQALEKVHNMPSE